MKTLNNHQLEVSSEKFERLKFDYDKAQEMIRHYEQTFWQVGAILLAGLFIMMGIVTTDSFFQDKSHTLIPVIAITLFIDLFWFLWYNRNRIIILDRFERLRDIENVVPELCNYSYCLHDEEARATISARTNFRIWLTGHIRHSLLLRWFCVLLPIPIIGLYIFAYLSSKTFDSSLIIHLAIFSIPLLVILLYPMEPYTRVNLKKRKEKEPKPGV